MMIKGKWVGDFDPLQAIDEEGGFVRQGSQFRHWITPDGSPGPSGEGGFPAEAGRYHLYVALICPWACRTLLVRKLKRLESVISVTVVEPQLTTECWRFGGRADSIAGSQADPLYGYDYIHQLYSHAQPDYSGQITVPVLWDKQRETIVNNESSEIIRMLNSAFGALGDESVDLYPAALRVEIDAVNERLYEPFNNGVYRAGFATTQVAYEGAVREVFDSLDWLEQRLEGRDYLVGDRLTEADVRAFVTLARFESAYFGLFKANLRELSSYPNVMALLARIHALPGAAETVNIEHIKQGYYSLKTLNPSGIVPMGPALSWRDAAG